MKKIVLITFLVLLIDQLTKIYVKTHFALYESKEIFSWFRITYMENLGMAYGISFGKEMGKNILTIFRIVMIVFIGIWLFKSVKQKASNYFIIPISLIFAGALGNLIDSIFYGLFFSSGTTFTASTYAGISKLDFTGYAPILQGAVVDMLEFPLFSFVIPQWVPVFGGKLFEFFKPIFNVADSAISIGVLFLILFHNKAFPKENT